MCASSFFFSIYLLFTLFALCVNFVWFIVLFNKMFGVLLELEHCKMKTRQQKTAVHSRLLYTTKYKVFQSLRIDQFHQIDRELVERDRKRTCAIATATQ